MLLVMEYYKYEITVISVKLWQRTARFHVIGYGHLCLGVSYERILCRKLIKFSLCESVVTSLNSSKFVLLTHQPQINHI